MLWNASSDPENDPISYALRIWGNSLDTTIAGLNDTTLAFNNPNAFQQNNSYQWQITASDGNLSTLSAIRNFYIASTAMAGVYTIGIGGDYPTITSAVEALETFGVGGAVTFNILPGVYDEQVTIDSVEGLSSSNMVVLQGHSGTPGDVIWKYSGQAPNSNFVLLLKYISNIIIRNITFVAAKPTAGRLVGLGMNCSNIKIENNNFVGVSTSSISDVYAIINSQTAQLDSISILENVINFGSYAVRLLGNTQQISSLQIFNNNCFKQSSISLLISSATNIEVKNNFLDNRNQLGAGMSIVNCQLPITISGNKIINKKWGVSLNNNSGGSGRIHVSNNFIHVGAPQNYNYTPFGMRISLTENTDLYYNTIILVGDTTETSRTLWVTSPINIPLVKNNILVNTAFGSAIYYSGTVGIESDYNDLYTNGNLLVTWNSSNYSTLSSYQTVTGQDLSSLNVNPSFLLYQDPHLNDFTLNNAGTSLAEVTTDIDGEPRHPNTPDIGADEFEPMGFEGTFTIGDGGDFPTINSAVEVLRDTIVSGVVTFKILPGVYAESVVLTKFAGVSASNYLVFESSTGNKSDVIWNYDQFDVANLTMSGARHIKLRNLTFTRTTNHGPLVEFSIFPSIEDSCSHILLEGNEFVGVYADPGQSLRLALLTSEFNNYLDSVVVVNNIFRKGQVAIAFTSSQTTGSGIVIENNLIEEPTQYGITLYQLNAPRVIKNEVRMLTSPAGKQFREGISVAACNGKLEILNNRVTINLVGTIASSSVTGIEIFACNGNTTRGLVANNFVRVNFQSSAHTNYTGNGITLFASKNQDVLFNTLRVGGGLTASSSKALYFFSGEGNHRLQNNISVNLAGGYALWVEGSSLPLNQSDYNNFLSSGSNLVRWGNTDYSNLASYQTGTGKDLNSLSSDPLFVSSDDLHIKSGSPVDGKGTPLAEVPRDIDNQLRSLTVPDIGADEYTAQRIIIKRKNKLNKILLPLTITRDSLHIDPTDDPMISGYVLSDVNVFIDTLVHTNLADLEISLTHKGVIDTLAKFLPDSASGFIGTILDDSGLLALNEGVSPYTGSYRPHSPLSVFNGVDPEGEWVLEIYDRSSGNFGILDAWGIELVFEQTTGVPDEQEENIIPDNFELSQNYPNPFNPSTTIRYSIPELSNVELKVYDILGSEVASLVNEEKDSGVYTVSFDASNLSSGIYLYRLQAGSFIQTKKMILIK